MKDYRSNISTNLRIYRSITEHPDRIEALNDTLNELDALGFGKLVQNFCTQTDPDRADDFLFEIWICQMLRRNPDVQALQYEPSEAIPPPDFRFLLHGVSFDLQVKRLSQIKSEITKRRFERECRKRLSTIQKPWLINFWVADEFTPQHLNPFFDYEKEDIGKEEVDQTRNYLTKPMGKFAILCCSKLPNHAAHIRRNTVYSEDGKVILFLTKDHLKEMLFIKERGEEPSDLVLDLVEWFYLQHE